MEFLGWKCFRLVLVNMDEKDFRIEISANCLPFSVGSFYEVVSVQILDAHIFCSAFLFTISVPNLTVRFCRIWLRGGVVHSFGSLQLILRVKMLF